MIDPHNAAMKFKESKIYKYCRKLLNVITEVMVLIAFTFVFFMLLLYLAKYLWFIFTSTPVGQAYSTIFEESYRMTSDVLNRNLISLAMNLTLTACAICFIIGTIFKFLHITRYLYSGRGFLGRILFCGLPLTYLVALYLQYRGNFTRIDTACIVAVVPGLCLFARCFKYTDDFVPEMVDVISYFQKKESSVHDTQQPKEELLRGKDELKFVTKQKIDGSADRPLKLKDIWEDYRVYIIAIPVMIVITAILFTVAQKPIFNKMDFVSAKEAAQGDPPIVQTGLPAQPAKLTGSAQEWYGKATVLLKSPDRHDILKAIDYLSEAVRQKPDYADAYGQRGTLYAMLDHHELAINDYDIAIRLKPRDSNLYSMRGNAYFAVGKISLACSDAKKACAHGNCKLFEIAKSDGDCL